MSEALMRRVAPLLSAEEKVKLLIWVGELELIRAGKIELTRPPGVRMKTFVEGNPIIEELAEPEQKPNPSQVKLLKRTPEEHELFINALLMSIIEERVLKKTPMIQRYAPQVSLTGEKDPAYLTQAGVITIFKKAMVFTRPSDAVSYYLNKRGRRNKWGTFLGFVIAELPTYYRSLVQPITIYTEKDPGIEHRKALGRWRRKHKIKVADYEHHMKHNTLTDFIEGNEILTPQERKDRRDEKVARRMMRDGHEPIDDSYKKIIKKLKEK